MQSALTLLKKVAKPASLILGVPAAAMFLTANGANADVIQQTLTGAQADSVGLSEAETGITGTQGALSISPVDFATQGATIQSTSGSVLFGASGTNGIVVQTTQAFDGLYGAQTETGAESAAIGLAVGATEVTGVQTVDVINVDGLGSVGLVTTGGALDTASGAVFAGASESGGSITQIAQTPGGIGIQSTTAGTSSFALGNDAVAGSVVSAEQVQVVGNTGAVQLSSGVVTTGAFAGPGANTANSGAVLTTVQGNSF